MTKMTNLGIKGDAALGLISMSLRRSAIRVLLQD